MSRDYHPSSVTYAKPNRSRNQESRRRDNDRPDPRTIPGEYGRSPAHQDHYNQHYRHPTDEYRHDGRAATRHDHHNRHYQLEPEREPRAQYVSKDPPRHPGKTRDEGPSFVHTPHPHRDPNRRGRDSRDNPLEQLFKPPPGTSSNYQDIHAAEVHAEAPPNEPPVAPPPPQPPILEEVNDIRKPRKIREYRIRRDPRPTPAAADDDHQSDDSASSSDDGVKDDRRKEKKRKKKGHKLWRHKRHDKDDKKPHRKESKPPRPDNWYQETHPEKVIKLGDITYIRARASDKKWIERLLTAFEAFGFVVIGVVYKGGDAILKIIAPIAVIKSYTEILGPALQGLVLGITSK